MRRVMRDPLRPPKAAADATRVHPPRKRDNVLPTMDKYGVQDIVRNLSTHPTPAEAQSEFERIGNSREQNPHLGVESARIAAGIPDDDLASDLRNADENLSKTYRNHSGVLETMLPRKEGEEVTRRANEFYARGQRPGYPETRKPGLQDAATAVGRPSNVGLRGSRINNEGEGGPVTAGTRGQRQVDARTSVSPKVAPIPARNRGVEAAINEGAADLSNVIANRNARVKKRRQAPTD